MIQYNHNKIKNNKSVCIFNEVCACLIPQVKWWSTDGVSACTGGQNYGFIANTPTRMALYTFRRWVIGDPQTTLTICHNTAQCRYNAVNFLKDIHKRHPIARPLGRGIGVFRGSFIWLIFCLISCYYLCNIVQYWTALKRHLTLMRQKAWEKGHSQYWILINSRLT